MAKSVAISPRLPDNFSAINHLQDQNDGDVAQMGERSVRNAEVGSSILLVSIIDDNTTSKAPRHYGGCLFGFVGGVMSVCVRRRFGRQAAEVPKKARENGTPGPVGAHRGSWRASQGRGSELTELGPIVFEG